MKDESFKSHVNVNCEYYPCHKNKIDDFTSCMFCYCPLYNFKDCGGDHIFNSKGYKDCSCCSKPHESDGYNFIMSKLKIFIFNK